MKPRRSILAWALATSLFMLAGGVGGYWVHRDRDRAERVAHGKELAYVIGMCAFCHTPAGDPTGTPDWPRFFAGGRRFEGWWGVSYSSNLTPDAETGIGAWTLSQFTTAVRQGRKLSGTRILMPHPWQIYHSMADSDVEAIFAYLQTLRPLAGRPPANEMALGWPDYEQRIGPPPAAPGGATPPTSGVARGRYLVDVVSGCSYCHSPHGIDPATYLAGGFPFQLPDGTKVESPNLTPDPSGIGEWNDEELVQAIRFGIGRDGNPLSRIMPLYAGMTEADLNDLLAYLRTVPPKPTTQPPPAGPVVEPVAEPAAAAD